MEPIYQLKNCGPDGIAIPCGVIAPQETMTAYLKHSLYVEPFLWESAFNSGLVALAIDGSVIPTTQAIATSYGLQALAQRCPEGGCHWNVSVAGKIVIDVRLDGLSVLDWEALGTSARQVATKLSGIANLLSMGMFKEAGDDLPNIPADGYLTANTLAKFADMVKSADAII